MPPQDPATLLKEQKRLLLLQSDLNRALLQAECLHVREQIEGWRSAATQAKSATPWVALATAAGGFAAMRLAPKGIRWLPAVWGAWRWYRRFIKG